MEYITPYTVHVKKMFLLQVVKMVLPFPLCYVSPFCFITVTSPPFLVTCNACIAVRRIIRTVVATSIGVTATRRNYVR